MKQKIVLIVSIAAAFLAAVLTRAYLASKDAEVQQLKAAFLKAHKTLEVLCFAREVPSGTILAKSDLGIKTVPASGLRGQALTEENLIEVVGRKVLNGHKTGELLFWADVEGGNPMVGGLAADIRKKMRAVSVNCSGAAAVSGMVKPNDHVDVIASFSFPKLAADGRTMIQELVTCTILQNVLVLATGKETAKSAIARSDAFGAGSYATVTRLLRHGHPRGHAPRGGDARVRRADQGPNLPRPPQQERHLLRKGAAAGRLREDPQRDRGAQQETPGRTERRAVTWHSRLTSYRTTRAR